MSKKLRFLVGLTALLALILVPALHSAQDEPVLKWHTYAGSSVDDQGPGIAMDSSGNIYFTGWSDGTWSSPINPHSGGRDIFVAKLNNAGELQWNTFLGSSHTDEGKAIAVDGSGNIYVVGTSYAHWGIPGDPFPGGGSGAFLAKLDSNGGLQWHKFMTTYGDQVGEDVAVDANGYVYVAGWGGWVWDTPPVEPHPDWDAPFVAKLDSSGAELWHAFVGGAAGHHLCTGVAVDASGQVYMSGRSNVTWGTPVNEHTGDGFEDGFVAKLASSGKRQWHTFFGGAGQDEAWDIAVDTNSNIYVTGHSTTSWGTPINPHSGGEWNAFVVKLDSSGVRQWHTFMEVLGWDIAVDGGQNVYVTGVGGAHFGYVAALNQDGVLQWNTPLEAGLGSIALDISRNVYVAGTSDYSWGTPVNAWAGGWDAFVAKIGPTIEPTELSPAEVWIGLKNSDDVGTYFDLKAEVFKNGTLIGSGEINNVRGGSSGFNKAVKRTIDLALSGSPIILPGDTLSFRLSVRISTTSGHRSGTARLWFNDTQANSSFDATIDGLNKNYYLLTGSLLGVSAGPGPKKYIDVFVDRLKGGNPFKPFGTWSKTF